MKSDIPTVPEVALSGNTTNETLINTIADYVKTHSLTATLNGYQKVDNFEIKKKSSKTLK